MQVKRLEYQIEQAEAQAQVAEAARSELQQQLQQLLQTLEDTRASSEQHVQVSLFLIIHCNIPGIEAQLPDPELTGQCIRAS